MKKYLLGLFAVVLAISFSAFTTQKSTKSAKNTQDYFWYVVDYTSNPSGEITSPSDIQFSAAQVDQPTADANDGCSGAVKDCLRGFVNQLPTSPATYPITTSGDSQTLRP